MRLNTSARPRTSRAASKCNDHARMCAVGAGVDGGAVVPRLQLYVGWLKSGLTGIIGTNIADA